MGALVRARHRGLDGDRGSSKGSSACSARTARARSAGAFFSLIIGTAISIAFLAVLRRYAAAAERLREGTRQAAVEVVFAQSSYFKLVGVLTIIGIVLVVLVLVVGIGAGISAISRGLS